MVTSSLAVRVTPNPLVLPTWPFWKSRSFSHRFMRRSFCSACLKNSGAIELGVRAQSAFGKTCDTKNAGVSAEFSIRLAIGGQVEWPPSVSYVERNGLAHRPVR